MAATDVRLSHDLPCSGCGHPVLSFNACSDICVCVRTSMPGSIAIAA